RSRCEASDADSAETLFDKVRYRRSGTDEENGPSLRRMQRAAPMSQYKLITDRELAESAAAIKRHGWRPADFHLQEDVFDPRTAEVEAALGEVGVHCRVTEAVHVYRLGPGFAWTEEFADDVRKGKFGNR